MAVVGRQQGVADDYDAVGFPQQAVLFHFLWQKVVRSLDGADMKDGDKGGGVRKGSAGGLTVLLSPGR